MAVDRSSLSTVPITPFFNDFQLPEATGFVWQRRDRFYLITNWHVAAATNIFTKRLLLKTGARPNKFRCTFIIRVGRLSGKPSISPYATRMTNRCGSSIQPRTYGLSIQSQSPATSKALS
jgi:hypothetical protein